MKIKQDKIQHMENLMRACVADKIRVQMDGGDAWNFFKALMALDSICAEAKEELKPPKKTTPRSKKREAKK